MNLRGSAKSEVNSRSVAIIPADSGRRPVYMLPRKVIWKF